MTSPSPDEFPLFRPQEVSEADVNKFLSVSREFIFDEKGMPKLMAATRKNACLGDMFTRHVKNRDTWVCWHCPIREKCDAIINRIRKAVPEFKDAYNEYKAAVRYANNRSVAPEKRIFSNLCSEATKKSGFDLVLQRAQKEAKNKLFEIGIKRETSLFTICPKLKLKSAPNECDIAHSRTKAEIQSFKFSSRINLLKRSYVEHPLEKLLKADLWIADQISIWVALEMVKDLYGSNHLVPEHVYHFYSGSNSPNLGKISKNMRVMFQTRILSVQYTEFVLDACRI